MTLISVKEFLDEECVWQLLRRNTMTENPLEGTERSRGFNEIQALYRGIKQNLMNGTFNIHQEDSWDIY